MADQQLFSGDLLEIMACLVRFHSVESGRFAGNRANDSRPVPGVRPAGLLRPSSKRHCGFSIRLSRWRLRQTAALVRQDRVAVDQSLDAREFIRRFPTAASSRSRPARSLSANKGEILHQSVAQMRGILLSLLGQVQIDHGRLDGSVPQIPLDDPKVHPLL